MDIYLYIIIFLVVSIFILFLVFLFSKRSISRDLDNISKLELDLDIELKRRYEVFHNLIKVAMNFVNFEGQTFDKASKLRLKALNLDTKITSDRLEIERNITDSIKTILKFQSSNPRLESSGDFIGLQRELFSIEDAIANRSRLYNGEIDIIKGKKEKFPTSIISRFIKMGDYTKLDIDISSKI